jgi:hypothetical protein
MALTILGELRAPDAATKPVAAVVAVLDKPQAFTGDLRGLATVDPDSATVLAALDEFERLSALPEDAGLRRWLETAPEGSGHVWLAEGTMAGLAEIASTESMPDLLPSAPELASDVRGLRDWLASRLPDEPTPDQLALKSALNDYLVKSQSKPRSRRVVTPGELRALGRISRMLLAELVEKTDAPKVGMAR